MGYAYQKLKSIAGLSLSLAKARFKLKNEGTWIGIFWYLLSPLLTFLLLLLIFKDRLGQNIPNYPIYLLLGIIIFNYANKISSESVNILKSNSGIIKSLNFSRESLVGGVVLSNLFSHLFEIAVLFMFLIFFKIPLFGMIYYPIILLFLSLFALGLSLSLASLGIYFFDLDNIWSFFSRLVWFATPIFYAVQGQTRLGILNYFNPMYYFITLSREIIIYARFPELILIVGSIFFVLFFLLIGILMFNKLNSRFAELI